MLIKCKQMLTGGGKITLLILVVLSVCFLIFELRTPYVSYGDSLTACNRWQRYVSAYLLRKDINLGIGGTKVTEDTTTGERFYSYNRINEIPESTELLFLMGGMNDSKDCIIGEPSMTDTVTFCGAYNTTIQRIKNRCPNVEIIILIPTQRKQENEKTKMIRSYTKKLADSQGLKYIDLSRCGIDESNFHYTLKDKKHPSHFGGFLMALYIIKNI